jgi:hypothetical protein
VNGLAKADRCHYDPAASSAEYYDTYFCEIDFANFAKHPDPRRMLRASVLEHAIACRSSAGMSRDKSLAGCLSAMSFRLEPLASRVGGCGAATPGERGRFGSLTSVQQIVGFGRECLKAGRSAMGVNDVASSS